MGKQRMPQLRGKADCCFGRKELGGHGTDQSDGSQYHHQHTHFQNIALIISADSLVDDRRHHQWYEQFKTGFQHFK